jgi:quinol-cytochrome oxidoreductase complex cytochrome b subunit
METTMTRAIIKRPGRLVARMLIGALIGIAVVAVFFAIDYLRQSDTRLYFVDNRDAFFTLLAVGLVIGGVIGLGWAIDSK